MNRFALASLAIASASCDTTDDCELPADDVHFVQLASDGYAVMALLSNGRAACWGDDRRGQCGLAHAGLIERPFLSNAVSCATHVNLGSVGMALTLDGAVEVWGSEDTTQFGDGPAAGQSFGMSRVVPLPRIADLALRNHGLAISNQGQLFYWGERKLSDDSREVKAAPVLLKSSFGDRPRAVSTYTADCLADSEGAVFCRSSNERGEVGDGTYEHRDEFVRTTLPEPATALGAGLGYNCALLESGRVACWGDSLFLGVEQGDHFPTPIVIPNVEGATELRVSVTLPGGCAFRPGGEMTCWGNAMAAYIPEWDGQAKVFATFDDVLDVAIGGDGRGCVLRASDNWVYCGGALTADWDDYNPEQEMRPIPAPLIVRSDEL